MPCRFEVRTLSAVFLIDVKGVPEMAVPNDQLVSMDLEITGNMSK